MIDFTTAGDLMKPADNYYLGLDCNGLGLERYRKEAQSLAEELDGLDDQLQNRDEFHITVLDPKELKKLKKKHPRLATNRFPLQKEEIKIVGIGRAADDLKGKVAYFLVIEWPHAQEFRESFGLGPKDLHITLGFIKGDVFNVDKSKTSLVWTQLG